MMKGIDISEYQKGLDISTLKSQGIDFIILRLGYGTTVIDKCFDQFYKDAASAGIPVGAYFYSLAITEAEAIRDAKKALSIANGREFPLGIYMDVESGSQLALRDSVLTNVVKAFCDTIRDAGYRPGAYGSSGQLWAKVGPSYVGPDILVWKAAWGNSQPKDCDIWQYSEKTRLNGFSTNVDGDYAISDKFVGLINDFNQKETSTDDEYVVEVPISKEVKVDEIVIRIKFKME